MVSLDTNKMQSVGDAEMSEIQALDLEKIRASEGIVAPKGILKKTNTSGTSANTSVSNSLIHQALNKTLTIVNTVEEICLNQVQQEEQARVN